MFESTHHLPGRTSIVRTPALLLMAALLLSACGSFNRASRTVMSAISPYKIDIVQGNFVSSEQVAALRPGMPRTQVRDVLGTPLLTDVFHADRWDYVFTMKRGGTEPLERRLTLYFNGDTLDRFEGDPMPAEAEFVKTLDSGRRNAKVPLLEASAEKLEKATQPAKKQRDKADDLPGRVNENAVLPSSYPPLESPSYAVPSLR
ncbi:MAG: outer membrane protein assembly factor BamE [Burkholderiaceae bacterium]